MSTLNQHEQLMKAIHLAVDAHKDTLDKGGQPYILHPLRVMLKMQDIDDMIVAVLHDVVEDTALTLEALDDTGFPLHIVDAVESVTRMKDETYASYIERAAANEIGRRVKIADLDDNMDIRRLQRSHRFGLTDEDYKRLNKYLVAWKRLTED